LTGTFTGSIERKSITNFGVKGAWTYPRTAQIFGGTPVISGTGKAMNFKLCVATYSQHQSEEMPIKIAGKVSMGIARDSGKGFQGARI